MVLALSLVWCLVWIFLLRTVEEAGAAGIRFSLVSSWIFLCAAEHGGATGFLFSDGGTSGCISSCIMVSIWILFFCVWWKKPAQLGPDLVWCLTWIFSVPDGEIGGSVSLLYDVFLDLFLARGVFFTAHGGGGCRGWGFDLV